jgi:hypothetical protein
MTPALAPAPSMRMKDRGRMMVCAKSAAVTGEDGAEVRLIAGQSFVNKSHFLVSTYPELFRPETRTPKRSKASHTPSRSQKPKQWNPLVRLDTRSEPSFTVTLSRNARSTIGDLAFSARGNHEVGGALFGASASEVRVSQPSLDPGRAATATASTSTLTPSGRRPACSGSKGPTSARPVRGTHTRAQPANRPRRTWSSSARTAASSACRTTSHSSPRPHGTTTPQPASPV